MARRLSMFLVTTPYPINFVNPGYFIFFSLNQWWVFLSTPSPSLERKKTYLLTKQLHWQKFDCQNIPHGLNMLWVMVKCLKLVHIIVMSESYHSLSRSDDSQIIHSKSDESAHCNWGGGGGCAGGEILEYRETVVSDRFFRINWVVVPELNAKHLK